MGGQYVGVARRKVPGGEVWTNVLDGSEQYLQDGADQVSDTPWPGYQGGESQPGRQWRDTRSESLSGGGFRQPSGGGWGRG